MENARARNLVALAVGLVLGAGCGSGPPTSEQSSALRQGACQSFGRACDATTPCCKGMACTEGICLNEQPTCMPDGALCTVIPCCGNTQCVNGLCGGACIIDGAPCDHDHPCCSTGKFCNKGVCGGVQCVPLAQGCTASAQCCSGLCNSSGRCSTQPVACSLYGDLCTVGPQGCCSASGGDSRPCLLLHADDGARLCHAGL